MKKQILLSVALIFCTYFSGLLAQSSNTADINVFPNPSSSGQVEVHANEPILNLLVINTLGETLINVDLSKDKQDNYIIVDLPVDAYTVYVTTKFGLLTRRLIVIH